MLKNLQSKLFIKSPFKNHINFIYFISSVLIFFHLWNYFIWSILVSFSQSNIFVNVLSILIHVVLFLYIFCLTFFLSCKKSTLIAPFFCVFCVHFLLLFFKISVFISLCDLPLALFSILLLGGGKYYLTCAIGSMFFFLSSPLSMKISLYRFLLLVLFCSEIIFVT